MIRQNLTFIYYLFIYLFLFLFFFFGGGRGFGTGIQNYSRICLTYVLQKGRHYEYTIPYSVITNETAWLQMRPLLLFVKAIWNDFETWKAFVKNVFLSEQTLHFSFKGINVIYFWTGFNQFSSVLFVCCQNNPYEVLKEKTFKWITFATFAYMTLVIIFSDNFLSQQQSSSLSTWKSRPKMTSLSTWIKKAQMTSLSTWTK